jgi:hypothetical protein
MSAQIVPLNPSPNQVLSVTLNINGSSITLGIKQYFNRIGGFWVFDIFTQQGVPLVSSVPLITGYWPAANILAPYEYMKIGEAFVINQNGANSDWPTNTNLGSGFVLLWDSNNPPGIAALFPQLPPVDGSGNWSSYNVSAMQTIFG